MRATSAVMPLPVSVTASLFIPVLWFGMDFQGTADTEITALQSRQQYLAMLADQKRCGAEPEPPPPPVARVKPHAKPKAPRHTRDH
ncbi:MAG TPA: hypothetical protein VHV26_07180 [Rhizomicrobium sp.]|nr:hypothetical protein [Rhizomicrobium sp.]